MRARAVPAVDDEPVAPDDLLGLDRVIERPARPLEELEVMLLELVAFDRLAPQPASRR